MNKGDLDKVYIFGAGARGVEAYNALVAMGCQVLGFIDNDTNKQGISVKEVPCISLDEAVKKNTDVMVVVSPKKYNDICAQLDSKGLRYILLNNVYGIIDSVEKERQFIIRAHESSSYYSNVENENSLSVFWSASSPFKNMFKELDLTNVIELACGWGRHVPKYMDMAGHITLIDAVKENIDRCKERFFGNDKISYVANNGKDFSGLPDASYTAVFSYDAMVHFEFLDIYNYLKEMYRVLRNDGKALIHHSNLAFSYKQKFNTSPGWRNYMSKDLFAFLAYRAGFDIVEQRIIDWDAPNMDCISLIEKRCAI